MEDATKAWLADNDINFQYVLVIDRDVTVYGVRNSSTVAKRLLDHLHDRFDIGQLTVTNQYF